jgi:type IV pilus assembly protein PilA
MARRAARKGRGEAGFTFVEILVVMLIFGLLAAAAIPAFFNQREKARDGEAKVQVRTASTAIESIATEKNGNYSDVTVDRIQAFEPALLDVPDDSLSLDVDVEGLRYRVAVLSESDNEFWIHRADDGELTYPCTAPDSGGCPADGNWGN